MALPVVPLDVGKLGFRKTTEARKSVEEELVRSRRYQTLPYKGHPAPELRLGAFDRHCVSTQFAFGTSILLQ